MTPLADSAPSPVDAADATAPTPISCKNPRRVILVRERAFSSFFFLILTSLTICYKILWSIPNQEDHACLPRIMPGSGQAGRGFTRGRIGPLVRDVRLLW